MNFLIRKGKVGDLAPILELIDELAEIKNEKDQISINIYDLMKDGFSIKPLFKTFVAEIDDTIVGFALFYMSYSTNGKSLILEDVFVSKKFKKLGIGISLFAKILDFAKKKAIHRIEWGVLERFESLIELYDKVGAKILKDTSIFVINDKTIDTILSKKLDYKKKTPFKKVVIRFGKLNDMPSVLELMKELAVYKKSSCDVDVYDLMKDGFSKYTLFKTIILEIDDEVVGMLLFYHSYSSFKGKSLIIEDISIRKKYRGYGYGKALNYKFFEYAKNKNIKRIEQAIFDFDKEAIDRCKEFGAKKVEGMRLVQISYDALNNFINKN